MASWLKGEQTVKYLKNRCRPESLEVSDLTALPDPPGDAPADHLVCLRLGKGDVDGACAAAYDAYRMAAEALLALEGARFCSPLRRQSGSASPCRV